MTSETHVRETRSFDMPALQAKMRGLLGEGSDAYPACLEKGFPHVFAKIVDLWGGPAMDSYFQSLMVADRPGRQGFPADAAMEILRLSLLHGSLKPASDADKYAWSSASDQEFKDYLDRRQGGERRQQLQPALAGYGRREEVRRADDLAKRQAVLSPLVDRLAAWIGNNELLTRFTPEELREAFAQALRKTIADAGKKPDELPGIPWG